MLLAELAVVLAAILVGARLGGVGLGTGAGLGLAVLVFVFQLPPSRPPGEVLAIIVAVVTAASAMQAAGGLDFLVGLAARALQARPQQITFVAPLVSYAFTFLAGTGHVAYAILPVIAETARQAGVRPERPLSISVIASQQAITASPISAAIAALVALLAGKQVTLYDVLLICVPSTLAGVVLGALVVSRVGVELADDPVYRDRLARGLVAPAKPIAVLEGPARRNAIGAVALFLGAALGIVALGLFPALAPTYPAEQGAMDTLPVSASIQILMYAAAALMMLFCGARPDDAATGSVARAGVVAVISVLGLGWMGSCFFEANRDAIVGGISDVVLARPWIFSLGLFVLSILLFSQATTVAALMPVGVALGLPPLSLVAMLPAVNGYFFLPTYGTVVAAVSFDATGTTHIGRYVLNHSFMLPGLVSVGTSVAVGLALARLLAE